MKILSRSFLAMLCFAGALYAQIPRDGATQTATATKPTLPTGPLLRTVDNFSRWEVSFAYSDDQQKKGDTIDAKATSLSENARPRKITTTKTGPIIHEETTDVIDRQTDTWFNGNTQYAKAGSSRIWLQASPGLMGDTAYHPLPANGFRNLDWITPDNYVGLVPAAGGRQYLVFTQGGLQKLDLTDAAERNDRMTKAGTIAYVDADSRLPILVRINGETRAYRFDAAPAQVQTLPVDLADQIKKGEEARARLLQSAARPY